MTEQDWQTLKEILSAGPPTHWTLFNRLAEENERLRKEVQEANERGEWMNDRRQEYEMENERLRKAMEEIAEAQPLSITHDIGYMQHVARQASEG